LDRPIIINSFNLCPLTQSTTLGTACLECEHMQTLEDEYFCTFEDDDNQNLLSVKDIINVLLDLLMAGCTKINRDKIKRIIDDI
jgi:hypothetical protein